MASEKGSLALNDALNKPKHKLGIDYRVAGGCLAAAVMVALFADVLFGLILLFVLPMVARWITRKDPQIYRLWCLSFFQFAYYDPGKVRRIR